jgi:hypothetical protein
MIYTLWCVILLALAAALLTAGAIRDQFIVVLRWHRVITLLLVRGDDDGRYTLFRPSQAPAVLARYAVLRAAHAVHAVQSYRLSAISYQPRQ